MTVPFWNVLASMDLPHPPHSLPTKINAGRQGEKDEIFYRSFLYGGDYNPEQWLSTPEILEEDIILMKQAHVNAVTLGVFAWSALEPSNDEYHFEWLERIIDRFMKTVFPLFSQRPAGRAPNGWHSDGPRYSARMHSGGARCTADVITTAIHLLCTVKKQLRSTGSWRNDLDVILL